MPTAGLSHEYAKQYYVIARVAPSGLCNITPDKALVRILLQSLGENSVWWKPQ